MTAADIPPLTAAGITTLKHLRILLLLPGNVWDIAKTMKVSRPTVYNLLHTASEQGLVFKDGVIFDLTAKGRALVR